MTVTDIVLAIIAALIGFQIGSTRRFMELYDASQRIRDLRLGLTYASTRATDAGAFAQAFIHDHTDLITRHWPDFYSWRVREMQREDFEDGAAQRLKSIQ